MWQGGVGLLRTMAYYLLFSSKELDGYADMYNEGPQR